MSTSKPVERAYGLDMPVESAVKQFAKVTKEELEAAGLPTAELIAEGEGEIVLFKETEVRKVFHNGEWWFSIVDVIEALTGSGRATKYWSDLKRQISEKEGFSELSENIGQLPLPGKDGKMYPSEVANIETLLRIMQSVPSPRAEPFKRWLAKVGFERIQEIQNPEIAIKRAILTYQLQGRSDDWIEKRIRSIVVRKELTSEWRRRGVQEGQQYAMLTNVISSTTFSGVTVEGHKRLKGLAKHHSLRDHMSDLELIFTMLGEKSTTEIARARDAKGYDGNLKAAHSGGTVARSARTALEAETGERVVTSSNFLGVTKRLNDPQLLTKKS